MNDKEKLEAVGCLVMIPAVLVSYSLRAWAITLLWAWFISPTWHIAAPNAASACGLSILVGLLTHEVGEAQGSKSPWTVMAISLMAPVFAVAGGWVVRWWFGA